MSVLTLFFFFFLVTQHSFLNNLLTLLLHCYVHDHRMNPPPEYINSINTLWRILRPVSRSQRLPVFLLTCFTAASGYRSDGYLHPRGFCRKIVKSKIYLIFETTHPDSKSLRCSSYNLRTFFCKPQICRDSAFLQVQSQVLCYGDAVFMIWFGSGTKTTRSGLGEDHVLP